MVVIEVQVELIVVAKRLCEDSSYSKLSSDAP